MVNHTSIQQRPVGNRVSQLRSSLDAMAERSIHLARLGDVGCEVVGDADYRPYLRDRMRRNDLWDGLLGVGLLMANLVGCISQGDTLEEAMANIQEAKIAWMETAWEYGDEISLLSQF